jgi:uncharacterized membrane protein
MKKSRLEAFSDGVLAILITIMVLELRVPAGTDFNSLKPMLPVILCYILSFIYLGIYWSNHHHLFYAVHHVTGGTLWANLHLLFWLSLVPFVTGWMGENNFAPLPTALYVVVLLMAAIAFKIVVIQILRSHGLDSIISEAIGKDFKGNMSILVYLAAIPLAFVSQWISGLIFAFIALVWLVPDRRIEKVLGEETGTK